MGELKQATISVSEAAKTLEVSCQTVRLLLQTQAVDWGTCYRLPRSKHFSYLIYKERFYTTLGIGGECEC